MTTYPGNTRWLSYGDSKRDWIGRLRSYWWVAYTLGVAVVAVGLFRLAQVVF